MSKLNYQFDTPIPFYFRKNGWLKPKKDGSHFKNLAFIYWCFSRCNVRKRKEFFDNTEIILDSFEFICGRNTAAEETGLTEKEVRGRLTAFEKAGILKKTANSKANRFTCYKWSTEVFSYNEGQLEGEPRANSGPTEGHKLEYRNKNKEEEYKEIYKEKIPSIDQMKDFVGVEEAPLSYESVSKSMSDNLCFDVLNETSPKSIGEGEFGGKLKLEEIPKKVKSKKEISLEAIQLTEILISKIKQVNPKFSKPTIKWPNIFDKLLKKRNIQEINSVIEWGFNNDFWRTTILSPDGLDRNLEKIEGQIIYHQRGKNETPQSNNQNNDGGGSTPEEPKFRGKRYFSV